MALFLLAAVITMIAHHLFYNYLDGRAVSTAFPDSHLNTLLAGRNAQTHANAIGNAFATVAKACLSSAVISAFVQLFWARLRSAERPMTIGQIDTVLAYRADPFDPTSISSWLASPFLSAITLLIAAFVAVPIAAPGALTVDTAAQVTRPCVVSTVDISNGQLYSYTHQDVSPLTNTSPTSGIYQLVSAVLMEGNYLSPRVPKIFDAAGSSLSSYPVSFSAPALKCENITAETFDVNSYLPYAPTPTIGVGNATVWNATYTLSEGPDHGLDFIVAARSLGATFVADADNNTDNGVAMGIDAVHCTAYNATYNVTVQIGATSTSPSSPGAQILVDAVALGNSYTNTSWNTTEAVKYYTVYDTFARTLNGSVILAYSNGTTSVSGNAFVAYSALAFGARAARNGQPWVWRTTLADALPSLMQNISLSFLSGRPVSMENKSPIRDTTATCTLIGVHFLYDSARLLATYAAACTCAFGAVLLGCLAVDRNAGVSESFAFSRMVGAGIELRDRLADASGPDADINLDTRVRVESKPYGSLIPANEGLTQA